MKKLLILTMLAFISTGMYANSNGIKLGLGSFAFGNAYLQYERAINDNMSAQVGFGFYFPFDPGERIESRNISINDTPLEPTIQFDDRLVTINEWSSTGFYINGEFRFYLGDKDALSGFYLAPYIGFHKNGDDDVTGTDDLGFNYEGEASMTYFGGGAQAGYQWLIADRVIIDWRILGVGAGNFKLSAGYTNDETGHDWDERANEIEDFLGVDLGFDTSNFSTSVNNRVDSELSFVIPMIRFGLSVGIAF